MEEAFAPSLTWAAQWMRVSWPEKGLKEEEQVGWAPRDSGASLISGVGTQSVPGSAPHMTGHRCRLPQFE